MRSLFLVLLLLAGCEYQESDLPNGKRIVYPDGIVTEVRIVEVCGYRLAVVKDADKMCVIQLVGEPEGEQ